MFRPTLLTTLLTLPIVSISAHNILTPSKVFFFDQLPSEAYDGDPDLTTYKDILYVRKDISYLDIESGPNLTCQSNGQVTLGFSGESALELNQLAYEQFLGHPVIIPHGYDATACSEVANHTIFGPRKYVPAEALEDLDSEDDFAVMIAMSEDDVTDDALTLSVIWATYHELVGVVGDAPEELEWLAKGVFPWSISTSSSSASSNVEKRAKYGGITKTLGQIFGKEVAKAAAEWSVNRVAEKIVGQKRD